MTEEDLQYIEEELGVSLPSDYRALLREFPFPADGILVGCLLIWLLIMRKRYTRLVQPLLTSCAFQEQGEVKSVKRVLEIFPLKYLSKG